MITGSSGSGKSTVVTALLEQIRDLAYQFCVIDPEGDYSEFADAVVVGDAKQEPRLAEVRSLLAKPEVSVVVNLLAIDPQERPRFLAKFLPEIAKLRSETGRPHWIVLDEAHHCLPAEWDPAPITLPKEFPAAIAVTVHPEALAPHFLELVSTVVGVGDGSLAAIEKFCKATGRPMPVLLRPHSPLARSTSLLGMAGLTSSRRAGRKKSRSATPANTRRAILARTGASISGDRMAHSTYARRISRPSCRWAPASMTRPGCTICGPASIRGGFVTPSRMMIWRRKQADRSGPIPLRQR